MDEELRKAAERLANCRDGECPDAWVRYDDAERVARFCNLMMEKAMAVRAKVTCESIEGNAVSFHTVYETDEQKGCDPENVRFTKATPWGNIRLGIDNPAALSQFEVGKSYYVDFTPYVNLVPATAK